MMARSTNARAAVKRVAANTTTQARRTTRARGSAPSLSQREVLRDVLLSANQCGAWLTLRELSLMTRYAEPSISAQLRHFRKAEFGGYVVEKRVRAGEALPVYAHGAVWEYRMSPRVRVVCGRSRAKNRHSSAAI